MGAAAYSSFLGARKDALKEFGADEVQKFAVDVLGDKLVDKTKDALKEECKEENPK